MASHAELLDPVTFAQDEPVGVLAVEATALPGPLDGSLWKYIPERLWHRLLAIGSAYQLHFSQVIEPVIDTVLIPEQCQSLAEELAFVRSFIGDPALQRAIEVLNAEVQRVEGNPVMRLVLSPP